LPQHRVLIIGPSATVLGGQALQAQRLLAYLQDVPEVRAEFLAVNPPLPGPFRVLQQLKFVRTAITAVVYWVGLLRTVPRHDVLHILSASYWSFLLSAGPALLVGKLFGKRTLLNYRSGEAEDHLARSWIARRLIRRFNAIVVPSEYLVSVFRRFGFDATAIPNIVDPAQFRFRERGRLRPLFISNRSLEPLYNVECTLRAFALIQRQHPDARLEVVGSGTLLAPLRRLSMTLQLLGVTFHGQIPSEEMAHLYDRADIFLNSPNIDNMPTSILEAQSCGLPVATTDAGGIPYIVTHEVTGLLVPVGDCEALARAALRLLSEPRLAADIVREAHRGMERCRAERVGPQWIAAYQRVIDS
jgi:glycosyltransferase involved in cell wall biosynthesis